MSLKDFSLRKKKKKGNISKDYAKENDAFNQEKMFQQGKNTTFSGFNLH